MGRAGGGAETDEGAGSETECGPACESNWCEIRKMPFERALITCMDSSALPPAQAVSGLVATGAMGAHVGLVRNGFLPPLGGQH